MIFKRDVLTLVCILVMNASVAIAQQPTAESTHASVAPDVIQSAELLIGYGDLLEVSVLGAPEYRYEVRTSSRGDIALPLAGSIRVSGLSVERAEQTIATRLQQAGAFNDPQVTVFEKEYATQGISVLGEVQKPGIYPLIGPHTLLDAISAAGGTTPRAGTVATITHRADPDKPTTVALSYSDTGKPVTTAKVQSGDTVMVSKAGLVYVVGDVHEPAGIVLENSGLTVLQAVAMAHGTNPTAKLSGAKLIRKTGNGSREIEIPLNKILKAKSPDLPLQPEDIVFVPGSAMKGATRRGLEAMVQAATGFVIYH
jgi:polysaccharide export outer membrane protein